MTLAEVIHSITPADQAAMARAPRHPSSPGWKRKRTGRVSASRWSQQKAANVSRLAMWAS